MILVILCGLLATVSAGYDTAYNKKYDSYKGGQQVNGVYGSSQYQNNNQGNLYKGDYVSKVDYAGKADYAGKVDYASKVDSTGKTTNSLKDNTDDDVYEDTYAFLVNGYSSTSKEDYSIKISASSPGYGKENNNANVNQGYNNANYGKNNYNAPSSDYYGPEYNNNKIGYLARPNY
ncbi:probable serine/threonine-protein kinase clkA [Biomphalaria glabrata]|uniref:Probable serine/threonine-protein kinase clkA n=1 Tax=Biomphalaria glabrata TaxID=6526 RepID=A0A9U8E3Y6_BIOGL|nr:probable serine/threonine-protein kinase clkA [Biomphalaria glabrata]